MSERYVVSRVATADELFESEPTLIYWVVIEVLQGGSKSTLKIRDGFSTSGKEVARFVTEYSRGFNLFPPIRCASGLYVDIDAWVSSYTVGFLPEEVALQEE